MGPKSIGSEVVPAVTGAVNLVWEEQHRAFTSRYGVLIESGWPNNRLCLLDQTLGQHAGERPDTAFTLGSIILAFCTRCRNLQ